MTFWLLEFPCFEWKYSWKVLENDFLLRVRTLTAGKAVGIIVRRQPANVCRLIKFKSQLAKVCLLLVPTGILPVLPVLARTLLSLYTTTAQLWSQRFANILLKHIAFGVLCLSSICFCHKHVEDSLPSMINSLGLWNLAWKLSFLQLWVYDNYACVIYLFINLLPVLSFARKEVSII